MRTGPQPLQTVANLLARNVRPNLPSRDTVSSSSSAQQEPPAPMCDICGGLGFVRFDVPVEDPRFGRLSRCTCKAAEDAARLQRLSGLTGTERNITFDAIDTHGKKDTAAMVAACREFVAWPYGFLTIHGTSGNAKTVALQASVNALVSASVEAVYITAFDLIGHIRDAFNEKQEVKNDSAYDRIVRFGTVQFLAVDEFDKVKWSSWVEEQITDLIDRRYRLGCDNQAGTMIAMNGNPELLPPWIYSRMTQGQIVANNDPDLRKWLK